MTRSAPPTLLELIDGELSFGAVVDRDLDAVCVDDDALDQLAEQLPAFHRLQHIKEPVEVAEGLLEPGGVEVLGLDHRELALGLCDRSLQRLLACVEGLEPLASRGGRAGAEAQEEVEHLAALGSHAGQLLPQHA